MHDTATKYVHAEAFKLMAYACQCGHRETIWNSRDGVTPFGLGCPSCGDLTLRHADWHLDEYAPNHAPFKGQRFWRDGTPDEAEDIMRRRIERMKGSWPITEQQAAELIKRCRDGEESEFRRGWPMIDRS